MALGHNAWNGDSLAKDTLVFTIAFRGNSPGTDRTAVTAKGLPIAYGNQETKLLSSCATARPELTLSTHLSAMAVKLWK